MMNIMFMGHQMVLRLIGAGLGLVSIQSLLVAMYFESLLKDLRTVDRSDVVNYT